MNIGLEAALASASCPNDDAARTAPALKIWRPVAGTIVGRHLERCAILLNPWPTMLRLHRCCTRPRDGAGNLGSPSLAMRPFAERLGRRA